tara:strand:- start:8976 stop:11699 length:2724 start_codon:yes stop_codon:yes gene_type:complete
MANRAVNGVVYLNAFTYNAGDSLDWSGASILYANVSSLDITVMYFNSPLQRLILQNSSTTDIVILNITNTIVGTGGTIEMDTGFVSLSSPYVVPVDSLGNRPTRIGYFVADGQTYTECTSLATLRADERGLHFIYDNATGAISVGDGTNGKVPSGNIQIPNYYVEMNGGTTLLDGGKLVGNGALAFIDAGFSSSQVISVDAGAYWGIVNATSNYFNSNLEKSSNGNFCFVQIGSNNRSITFGENSSTDHILYSIEAIPTSERVKNYLRPLNGIVEARYLTQPASQQAFPFTSLNNDGGNAIVIDFGGNKNVFELEGGVGGSTYVKYSTGYRIGDGSFYVGLVTRNSDADGAITGFERIGSEAWPGQSRHVALGQSGAMRIGSASQDIVFPADADFYEMFNVAGDSKVSVNRLINNGTSARGERDYNLYAPRGGVYSNIKMLNDSDHGNQRQDNTDFHFVSMIGRTPKFGYGMTHSEIITNSAADEVSVWMNPFAATTGNVVFNNGKAYYEPNTVAEQESGTISGVGIATIVIPSSNSLEKFTFECKIWLKGGTEPAAYTTMNTANVQALQAGYTTATRWLLKTKITKNGDDLDEGYVYGIEIQCSADPTFIWAPDAEDMILDISGGMLTGDYIRLENAAGVTQFYGQASGSSEQVAVSGDYAGEVWKRTIDREGYSPDVGSFTVVAGLTLPVSVALFEYKLRDGGTMYSNSYPANVSVVFDLATPQATITINNAQVSPQAIFDEFEHALLTEAGMAWHSQQGTIVQWDDIIQGGKQLYLQAGIRLFGVGLNAGVIGIVGAVDDVIVAAGSAQVTFGSAYKEYTQADRDRDDLIKSTVDVLPDSILNRNLASGSNGGRTVKDALRGSRNKVSIVGTVMTVYQEDDSTVAWTANLEIATRGAINSVDPS